MKIRWFWFDHVPPGVELTEAERAEMKKRAHPIRYESWSLRDRIWVSLPYGIGGAALIVVGLVAGKAFGWDLGAVHLVTLSIAAVFYYYLWSRTHGPSIWRALHDMGHPVCCECGYSLKNLVESHRCPECGWSRVSG